jgi:predicted nucleic acid-binding protein
MILADSNLIIYAASGNYPALVEWFAENKPAVSAISLVEVLGYHNLDEKEKKILTSLFTDLETIYPDEAIFQKAIALRQRQAMSLGDALIAATALHRRMVLATRNTDDFSWVESLELLNPVSD